MSYLNVTNDFEVFLENNVISFINNSDSSINSSDFKLTSMLNSNHENNFIKNGKKESFEEIEMRNNEKKDESNFDEITNNLNFPNLNINDDIEQNITENKKIIGKKILKKIEKPKYIAENQMDKTIFSTGDFDNYSKNIINDVKNWQNKNLIIKYQKRKYRKDEILLKFMPKLFKKLISKINKKLTKCKSKHKFKYLPKSYIKKYIGMISKAKKQENIPNIDYTLEDILSIEFDETEKKNKLENNKNTLKYLKEEKNKAIYEKSDLFIFKDLKFSELINNFFNSKEFGMDISILKDKNEEEDYIKEYIFQAKKILNLFCFA